MKTMKNMFVGIAVPFVALLFYAVTLAEPLSDPSDLPEIKITARGFEFNPKTINVRRGERVRLAITSEDLDLEFAAREFNIFQSI